MGQFLPWDSSLLVEESTDLPLLPMPLTPRLMVEEMVLGSAVGSPAGEPVSAPSPSMPDLSREGPFDVHKDASGSGASPRVLDSLPGCQYRMTSYDMDNSRSDFSPAYGIHLHDPRLLEYVGVPESTRLLSHSPEYWLHHMGRERTMAAALQLQHDAGLILSNLQVLGQFVTSLNRMSSGSCGWHSIGSRFRRKQCSLWCRPTVFDGRLTAWRPWACGVHQVRKGFLGLCRRRATCACPAQTVFLIFRSSVL